MVRHKIEKTEESGPERMEPGILGWLGRRLDVHPTIDDLVDDNGNLTERGLVWKASGKLWLGSLATGWVYARLGANLAATVGLPVLLVASCVLATTVVKHQLNERAARARVKIRVESEGAEVS